MKKRLLTLLAFAFPLASVAGEYTVPNEGGGLIHLTFETSNACPAPTVFVAWSATAGGHTITGCWFPIDQRNLRVVWANGELSTYPAASATLTKDY